MQRVREMWRDGVVTTVNAERQKPQDEKCRCPGRGDNPAGHVPQSGSYKRHPEISCTALGLQEGKDGAPP